MPCGKCPTCLRRRLTGWAFRLEQEQNVSDSSHFITLTYDTSNIPIDKKGRPVLEKADVQKFLKRLRFAQHCADTTRLEQSMARGTFNLKRRKPIKYFAVGEYGTRTKRPHYHLVLFNADLELIQDAWQQGHVHYGTVTGGSVGYTLKYMMKWQDKTQFGDLPREFSLMSKGLGINYLTAQKIAWHKRLLHDRVYIPLEGGKKIAMPRYYRDKIYNEHQKKALAFWSRRKWEQQLEKHMKEAGGYYEFSLLEANAIKQEFKNMYSKAVEGRVKI